MTVSHSDSVTGQLGSDESQTTEASLTARDRVGIQDFVLLDAYTSETAFLDNLKKRFHENLIYTYIGTLLVSVNPYKELDNYSKKQMDTYMGVNFFELPPHIYALADNVFRTMLSEFNNHFILISGESGAGKTEASKKILQYYAVSCPSTRLLNNIRDRLLLSNPVLEAFGNAKTLKNDNSSRFGKYMDIQFDHQGGAVGGHILSYLLEKSRVVHQNHGERNFHIFYQLVDGGEDDLLRWLGLQRNCQHYSYLVQVWDCAKVSSINDKSDWRTVRKALSVIEFSESDIEHLFGIIASVLHLGNIKFEADVRGYATLDNNQEMHWLLGIPAQVLQQGLTHRKIEAKTEEVLSPFSVDHAVYARDALAKAIYGRTFNWLVNKVNESLANKDSSRKTVIGLLDIYGFEVFNVNSFEQFCINYCNEKLQQLFIRLTLKSEQEEYEMEGIEVTSLFSPPLYLSDISDGNCNECDILKKSFLICTRNHLTFASTSHNDRTSLLSKHRLSPSCRHKLADQKTRKTLDRGDFRLLHYAGEVTYCVVGFLDKNNDLLYRNGKEVMRQSKNAIIRHCFPSTEPDSKRRPETVVTQFKSSLVGLTEILMSKEPWYVRCIKPNEAKQPGRFDDVLVRHQVKYLGLMEHLRVRRAGFAYRRKYEIFLQRYKPLCPDTWPNWKGTAAEGVRCLIKHLGYKSNEYKMGRTKIFIRHPRTLFATEDAFQVCKHKLATRIQAKYKGYRVKGDYLKQKEAATRIETCWRGLMARKEREKRSWAVTCPLICSRFIKGFMTRNQPACSENTEYLAYVRQNYLTRLKENLPKTVLEKDSWLTPPPIMQEVGYSPRSCLHRRAMVLISLLLKLQTSSMFKGKKENYPFSVCRPFLDTRISKTYSVPVVKYDRNGFRPRLRQLIFSLEAAYLVEEAKIKQRIDYKTYYQTNFEFNFIFFIIVTFSIRFDIQPGREGFVDFKSGQESIVYRAKNGHLTVVRAEFRQC
uniref:Myosin IHb n=1 Tax=Scophthalmus maximus TaxID=52904 RepID=A0A8D3CW81_SCOMX